jgi:hypothetical protein
MGADIHAFAERKINNKWERATEKIFDPGTSTWNNTSKPFSIRSYGIFGFLADVRNYSHIECITGETRGLPQDSEYLNSVSSYCSGMGAYEESVKQELFNDGNYHSFTYVTLKELLEYDYDKVFEDRRYTKQESPNVFNGAAVAKEGEGQQKTIREFLGSWFFDEIEILKTLGEPEDVRVVMWFDN